MSNNEAAIDIIRQSERSPIGALATLTESGGQRFLIRGIGWDGYQTMLRLVGDRPIRLTYDRGNLELMSPHSKHERLKSLLGRMVEALTEELDIPMISAGSTTFNLEEVDRGLEPDECFYLTNASRVQDAEEINLESDPPPDLAVEIDITSSSLNRLGIYAALRVPEVWRFEGKVLSVLLLQPDGTYAPSESSAAFPFLPMTEITRFLREHKTTNDTRWGRAFRGWVRSEIVPRVRGASGQQGE
jgi:Uma2 family endonuclease